MKDITFAECLVVIVILCVYPVEPALIRAPQNTAVTRGSEVTLNCTSDVGNSFITWFNSLCETYTVSHDCTRVYNGYNTLSSPPRYTVTSVNNSPHVTRDLSISETKLADAGVFVCVENIPGHSVQQISSAQLVVIDNTSCSTNLSASGAVQEYDVITMTCSITYSGNWAPVMRWSNSVTRHNFTNDVITLTTNDMVTATVTSQLSVVASRGLNSSEIICVTYFTEPSPALPTSATNIPSYTYNWTSPTFNVIPKFAPRNLQIIPRRSTYQPGDRIQCSAEGNPEPSYQWTDLVNGTVIPGAFLVVGEDMVNGSYVFQCTASNYYNGELHEIAYNITFFIQEMTSVSAHFTTPVTPVPLSSVMMYIIYGCAGAGLLFIILIAVVIVLCVISCRKRRSMKDDDAAAAGHRLDNDNSLELTDSFRNNYYAGSPDTDTARRPEDMIQVAGTGSRADTSLDMTSVSVNDQSSDQSEVDPNETQYESLDDITRESNVNPNNERNSYEALVHQDESDTNGNSIHVPVLYEEVRVGDDKDEHDYEIPIDYRY